MIKHWWKFFGVLFMLYAIIAGFLMPLKPGITNVSPRNLISGELSTITVSTYNAKLNVVPSNDLRAWIVYNSESSVQAKSIKTAKDNTGNLEIDFELPEFNPTSDSLSYYSLVIDGPGIGSFVLPSGVFISQDSVNLEKGENLWSNGAFTNLNDYKGFAIPFRNILQETLRNTYFHVSLWFSMFILYFVSVIYSINYLRRKKLDYDNIASSLVEVGTLFGILGFATGSVWAKNTWGAYWTPDVKLNMAAISMMIYLAYLVLRSSIADDDRKAVIASSYNIFAFFIIIPLIFVIPRLTDSLHPGNGGNPGFGGDDMDNTMRMVFYPAIIGFTLLGIWISSLSIRYKRLKN